MSELRHRGFGRRSNSAVSSIREPAGRRNPPASQATGAKTRRKKCRASDKCCVAGFLDPRNRAIGSTGVSGRREDAPNHNQKFDITNEVKALGTAFNGSGLNETASWTDTGTGGAGISSVIGSLSNNTAYKWRARIKCRLSDGAPQPFSRWFFIPSNALTESDFRVKN